MTKFLTTCGASDFIICSDMTAFCNLAASFASLIAVAEGMLALEEEEEGEGTVLEEVVAGLGGGGLRIGCFLRGGGIVET